MNETSDILLSECITFLGEFLTRQISRNPIIFLIQIKYYLQICFFVFEFIQRSSCITLKNILKSPPKIMFLQCKYLQKVDRLFSRSYTLLTLYRLISKKSSSLTFTSYP